jgi:hypothetical protein
MIQGILIFFWLQQLLQQAFACNFRNVFFSSTTPSTVMALLLQLLQTNLLLATLSTSFFFWGFIPNSALPTNGK